MVPLRAVAFASAAAVLLVPAVAQAKTKSVYVGPPRAAAKKMGETTTANAFFPSKLKVNVGDSVKFVPAGFHTVNFPKKGDGPLQLIIPTGQKVAGAADAAGAAFWFNGQDALSLNPAFAAVSNFGKSFSYNGAKQVESGLPGEKAKPMTVKFTKAGTYTVLLRPAPGHEGRASRSPRRARRSRRPSRTPPPSRSRPTRRSRPPRASTRPTRAPTPSTSASRPRAAWSTSAWSRPRSPSRQGHDGQVPDDQGHLRGPHGHVRPGRHRGPVVVPRRHRGLVRVAVDRPAGRLPERRRRRSR